MSHFSQMPALRLAGCVLLLGALSATWAKDDPTRTWFYCYDPSSGQGRNAYAPTIYVSGVSKAARVTGNTGAAAAAAFRAYVIEKYGVDAAASCEWRKSESDAQGALAILERRIDIINSDAKANGGTNAKVIKVVATGWVWNQIASDAVPTPPPTPPPAPAPKPEIPKPGAISH
jgi:hypothetical protein